LETGVQLFANLEQIINKFTCKAATKSASPKSKENLKELIVPQNLINGLIYEDPCSDLSEIEKAIDILKKCLEGAAYEALEDPEIKRTFTLMEALVKRYLKEIPFQVSLKPNQETVTAFLRQLESLLLYFKNQG
jgi:hypothetical protein